MTVSILFLDILSALLIAAALFDLTSYTIPNRLTGAMFVLFAAFLLVVTLSGHRIGWNDAALHLLAGAIALAIGLGMFAVGWIGGGDAKLFAIACLWLGWGAMYEYAIVASLMGGVLTVALLILRRVPLPSFLAAQPWLLRLADREAGVPYGVALACAAIAVLPDTDLMRLVSAS